MSFMVGISTKEGLVMAADSRGYFCETSDHTQRPIAYFDRSFKLFAAKKHPIGIALTGTALLGDAFISAIAEDYLDELDNTRSELDPAVVLDDLAGTQLASYFADRVNQFDDFVLMAGGYYQGRQKLCTYSVKQNELVECLSYGLIASDKPDKRTVLPGEFESVTLEQAEQYAEQIITDYARRGDRSQTIGGPIDILAIHHDGTEWRKRKSQDLHISSFQQFRSGLHDGTIELTYLAPYNEKDLWRLIFEKRRKQSFER